MSAVAAPGASLPKLNKLLGKGWRYRLDPKAPSAEERAEALAQLPGAEAEYNAAQKACRDRVEALLAGDADYQRLRAARDAAQARQRDLWARVKASRITVGTQDQLWFSVHAEGDTWAEIVTKLEARKARRDALEKGLDALKKGR
jgi:hypothetical protein